MLCTENIYKKMTLLEINENKINENNFMQRSKVIRDNQNKKILKEESSTG